MTTLESHLTSLNVDKGLVSLIRVLMDASQGVSRLLRSACVKKMETANAFGDEQLSIDVESDALIFDLLRESKQVSHAASEEQPELRLLSPDGEFSVVFDPLDGSSIVDCNWTVGSIFGVYRGKSILGKSGRDQVMAAISVYGPRTAFIVAIPQKKLVLEASFFPQLNQWLLTNTFLNGISRVCKSFSPANLRSTADLPGYVRLMEEWSSQKRLTLRYTGGMVPDIAGILIKGNGIFCSPVSQTACAKLRLVFECAPVALIVETAGGSALTGSSDFEKVLDRIIRSLDDRVGIICGSSDEVDHAVHVITSLASYLHMYLDTL